MMSGDPDLRFELLRRQTSLRVPWFSFATAATALSCAIGWYAYELRSLQALRAQSQAIEAQALARDRPARAPALPPYHDEALRAARLLEVPLNGWWRELENCQPTQAVTLTLRINALERLVQTTVLTRDTDLESWTQCLNAGLHPPAWQVIQITADDSSQVVLPGQGQRHVVALRRQEPSESRR